MLKVSFCISCLAICVQVSSANDGFEACGSSSQARELARLVITDKDQKRPLLECNALLAEIADKKAQEMAQQGKVSHDGPGGTPNLRLINNGYPLSISTSAIGTNHVESIMGGVSHAEAALDYFRNSYAHRIHLFGEHPFYLEQYEIGVGYAEEWYSPHVNYWVVYIAKPDKLTIEYGERDPEEIKYLGIYKK